MVITASELQKLNWRNVNPPVTGRCCCACGKKRDLTWDEKGTDGCFSTCADPIAEKFDHSCTICDECGAMIGLIW